MKINIFDIQAACPADRERITRLVRRILRAEGYRLYGVNIIICHREYMRDLNRRFLKRDRTTNVISFDLDGLAEIYVSRDHARSAEEVLYFIAHGLLHIVGYDHKTREDRSVMDRCCRKYIAEV
jgi:probable rRNA maturation factor